MTSISVETFLLHLSSVLFISSMSLSGISALTFSFCVSHSSNAHQLSWQFACFFCHSLPLFIAKSAETERKQGTTPSKIIHGRFQTSAKHVKRFIRTCSFNFLKTERQPPSGTQIYGSKKSIPTFQRLRIDRLQLQTERYIQTDPVYFIPLWWSRNWKQEICF